MRDTLKAVLAQRPASYWAIFDETGKRNFYVSGSDWGDFAVIERRVFGDGSLVRSAPSLEALARVIGVPPPELLATVRRANALAAQGKDADFGRIARGRMEGLSPIEKPPFYAVQFFPMTRKSMGGVRVDRSTRVLDRAGQVIPGLYAVGELTGLAGINGKAGLEGTFLGPSIFTGRAAGRAVVAELALTASNAAPSARAPADATRPVANDTACQACHPLGALASAKRAGYSHFEQAHTRVLELGLPCARCHAELAPHPDKAHRVNREAQIATCAFCHLATAN
jgi:succinate dehydrogenase/fumarate reductase flavoprotein subunit